MNQKVYNVLFLCTGNSARSILAEAILNQLGQGKFRAYSAGSFPRGDVHPLTLEALEQAGFKRDGLRSKSWNEYADPNAPVMDFVFTVCDQAAGEVCPTWPGQPVTAHWGFADPAAVQGDMDTQRKAFSKAFIEISNRLRTFLSLPLDKLDRNSLQHKVRDLHQE